MTAQGAAHGGGVPGQFNEAMREAELDDVKKQIEGMNESVVVAQHAASTRSRPSATS